MEASAVVAAAAGRLAFLGSAAGPNFTLHRLPAVVQHHRLTAATPNGLPLFSSISFRAHRVSGAAAPKRFASSSLHNSGRFSQAWDPQPPPGEGVGVLPHEGALFDDGAAWTAVLLGWLGSEHKHLKRYADIYRRRGFRTVPFVVPVGELFFDFGRRVEGRIARLAGELAAWAEGTEEDGRERKLVFHTFSNTGWYTYGAILESLQSRGDVIQKIKGCIVDSGADPDINPQVWAAGFCAALLKKRSSLTYASVESIEGKDSDFNKKKLMIEDSRPYLIESFLLSVLEKLFTFLLRLPYINQRLNKIITILSEKQPSCPQLYLYSSDDKVIPVRSIELFIQEQKSLGREVWTYDFISSPHVDHFRAFPHIYSAKLDEFLKECATKSNSYDMQL